MTAQLPTEADIAIIGAGLAGASLALLLAASGQGRRIVLVDAQAASPPPSPAVPGAGAAVMALALAESSRLIYQRCGLWPTLHPHAAPITRIQVSHRGHLGAAHFAAAEDALAAYGQVIEDRHLGAALDNALAGHANVVRVAARVTHLRPLRAGMALVADGAAGRRQCQARLVVLADGTDSPLRALLGIAAHTRDYQRSAILATLTLANSPDGCAWERFTDSGPIALLPLPPQPDSPAEGPSPAVVHRASLVWTLPPARATALVAVPPVEFIAALRAEFGDRAGPVVGVGERQLHPLRRVLAEEQIRSHLVLVGNAAHSLHPVAGQGFNLTLRDLATLTEVLVDALGNGQAVGELAVLQRYLALQYRDQQRTTLFSDRLSDLFAGRSGLAGLWSHAASFGLIALDLLPPARAAFTRLGAGLVTREARLHG